jgi:hypothetical protein
MVSTPLLKSTTSPANTALDPPGSRRTCSYTLPGIPPQEQAEAQSGSKATRPKTRRATEASPVNSRVGPEVCLILPTAELLRRGCPGRQQERREEARRALGVNRESRILLFNTEGATDPEAYGRLVGVAYTSS